MNSTQLQEDFKKLAGNREIDLLIPQEVYTGLTFRSTVCFLDNSAAY